MAIFEIEAPNGKILEIEGENPPSEAELDKIFAQTGTTNNAGTEQKINKQPVRPSAKGVKTPEQISDYFKQNAQYELAKRREFEDNHPVLTRLNKDFNPIYRGQQAEWEQQAKYGINAPLGEQFKTNLKQFVSPVIPAINMATAAGTSGMGTTGNIGRRILGMAGAGGIQGTTAGGLNAIGDRRFNDIVSQALSEGVAGGLIGSGFPLASSVVSGTAGLLGQAGRYLPLQAGASIAGVKPETLTQAIKPYSQALDLNADQAQALLYDTTQNVRNAYNNLLNKRGQAVNEAVENLRGKQYRIPAQDLQNDITQVFDQYSGDLINPARNMTGNLEENLIDLIENAKTLRSQDFIPNTEPGLEANNIINDNEEYFNSISPIDLEKAKQQIGHMINWSDETAKNYKNPILEQLYGKYNNRLSDLSPELMAANEDFATLRNFKKNEGVNTILRSGNSIDTASSKLRNYNSTVTSGNKNRNIQDLEKILVENGEQPFLDTVDDVNAAMDLNNSIGTGRNFGGITDLAKSVLVRPVLKGIRNYNRFIDEVPVNHPFLDKTYNNVVRPAVAGAKNISGAVVKPLLYRGYPFRGYVSNEAEIPLIQLDENGELLDEY